MIFDAATVYRLHLRLRELVRVPRLFDDRMPAGRVRRRVERFRRWCGPLLWQMLCNWELKRIASSEIKGNCKRDDKQSYPRVSVEA